MSCRFSCGLLCCRFLLGSGFLLCCRFLRRCLLCCRLLFSSGFLLCCRFLRRYLLCCWFSFLLCCHFVSPSVMKVRKYNTYDYYTYTYTSSPRLTSSNGQSL